MYDLAIIGAGPAGAMLARLVGARYRVLLLDARPFDGPADPMRPGKCCGGLLAPDAQQVLAELGLGVPQQVLTGPQLFVVRTLDIDHALERSYQRFYINVHRELFDRWLVSLVPPPVDTRFGCRLTAAVEDAQGITLTMRTADGATHTERTRLLVGADSAHSLVRKRFFHAHPRPAAYLAIQEWYEADRALPYFSAIFDRQVTDFYGWTIPKDDVLIIGAALTPRDDPHGKFTRLKEQLAQHGMHWGRRLRREGAMVLRPTHVNQLCPGHGRVALLGEAAGWISPSSAEGFSYAFRSAIALAYSLECGLDGAVARYRARCASLQRNIRGKLLKSPGMYTLWLRKTILQTGVGSLTMLPEPLGAPVIKS